MSAQPFRLQPQMAVEAYQTYSLTAPHDRLVRAACEQVGCEAYLHGWESTIDESTELGQKQAAYIRQRAGRTFRELRTAGLTVFRFDSGQRCFADHQTRPEIYLVRDGDWRGNPTGRTRRHVNAADWQEDMQENLDAVRRDQERG